MPLLSRAARRARSFVAIKLTGMALTRGTIEISTESESSAQAVEIVDDDPLPTYTPPAPTQAPFTNQLAVDASDDAPWTNLPPLVPIALLGGLGMMGLIISLLRK